MEAEPVTEANPYAFPLRPDEVDQLHVREWLIPERIAAIEAYGREHPDAWAGVFINEQGDLEVQFSADLGLHARPLFGRFGDLRRAGIEVRAVDWSIQELTKRRDRLTADLAHHTTPREEPTLAR